jgi:subfamily B ATP-binding cassette protein MsbA
MSGPAEQHPARRPTAACRVLACLRPYLWPHVLLVIALMIGSSAVESVVPVLARFTFDHVFMAGRGEMLRWAVAGIVGLAFIRGVLDFGGTYGADWISYRVVADLRKALTAHLQDLDLAFLARSRAGQIVSSVTADVVLVRVAISDALLSVFRNVTRLLGLLAAAMYIDTRLALFASCLFPVAALPLRYSSARLRQTARRQQETMGRLTALLHENVQGARIVKSFCQERHERRRFADHVEGLTRIGMQASLLRLLPVTELLAGGAIAAIVWYGGTSVIEGTRSQGTFVAFVITLFLLYEPFKQLVRTNASLQQGLAGAERVFGILDTRARVGDRPGAVALRGVEGAIELRAVRFAYEPGAPVLCGIDLRIPAGGVVALVGPSGGGKSTVADLIPRFHDVTGGRITIDGVDVRDFTLRSLRRQIGVVSQLTFLFNDTIRNNIAYGDPGCAFADIEAAARAANAHDFIMAMPRGYETVIGDLGVLLSGGQRQRLAIARALLRDAPILILDEATSALDGEGEALVQDALDRLMADRTTLVVAHRLSTVRRAHRIAVLAGGRIVESGTHEELLIRRGEYWRLHQRQAFDMPPEPSQRILPSAHAVMPFRRK